MLTVPAPALNFIKGTASLVCIILNIVSNGTFIFFVGCRVKYILLTPESTILSLSLCKTFNLFNR